jgi:hypothetical protein
LTSRADEHFRINVVEQNRILAHRCLDILNTKLKFDICNIGNPSLLNKEIEDLPERVDECISEGLRYSCRSFAHHISKLSGLDAILGSALNEFASKHLLHWIESMSLLGEITEAENCLQMLTGWMKVREQLDVYTMAETNFRITEKTMLRLRDFLTMQFLF